MHSHVKKFVIESHRMKVHVSTNYPATDRSGTHTISSTPRGLSAGVNALRHEHITRPPRRVSVCLHPVSRLVYVRMENGDSPRMTTVAYTQRSRGSTVVIKVRVQAGHIIREDDNYTLLEGAI